MHKKTKTKKTKKPDFYLCPVLLSVAMLPHISSKISCFISLSIMYSVNVLFPNIFNIGFLISRTELFQFLELHLHVAYLIRVLKIKKSKEWSVILTTSFYDINQKILTKNGYFQNFSWFKFYILCENCFYFMLKWFMVTSTGEMCFLEGSYK